MTATCRVVLLGASSMMRLLPLGNVSRSLSRISRIVSGLPVSFWNDIGTSALRDVSVRVREIGVPIFAMKLSNAWFDAFS